MYKNIITRIERLEKVFPNQLAVVDPELNSNCKEVRISGDYEDTIEPIGVERVHDIRAKKYSSMMITKRIRKSEQ